MLLIHQSDLLPLRSRKARLTARSTRRPLTYKGGVDTDVTGD